jgi:hypothetical protein
MMRFGDCAAAYIAAHREKPDACAAMAVDASELRLSGHRRSFGPGRRYGARHEDPRTDLEDQVANGGPGARQNRKGIGLGDDTRLPPGREPSALARPHQNLLPAISKVHRVEHHPALPYRQIDAFMLWAHIAAWLPATAYVLFLFLVNMANFWTVSPTFFHNMLISLV